MRPPLAIGHLLLPKRGAAIHECEDAVLWHRAALRFAVSDGATEAYGAGAWARTLCRAWTTGRLRYSGPTQFAESVRELGRDFLVRVAPAPNAPWFVAAKWNEGSYATCLFLSLHVSESAYNWDVLAIGDCCLFHFTLPHGVASFPLASPDAFGYRPFALPSRVTSPACVADELHASYGTLSPGEMLVLTTDAAASWLLSGASSAPEVCDALRALADGRPHAMHQILERDRGDHRLRNDDVAVLVLHHSPPCAPDAKRS